MQRKKTWLLSLTLVLLAGILTACGGTSKATSGADGSDKQIVIDISATTSSASAAVKGIEKFVEELERLTDGKVTGKIYPNNQFGGEREVIEMMGTDSLDMALASSGPMGTFVNEFNMLDLPYLFDSLEHAFAVLDGEIGQELSTKFEEQANVTVLGYMDNGFRQPTNSVRAMASVDDAKGLKVRTQENEIQIDTWSAYGANPTPIAWTETFTSLQQKVVDGQANPIDVIYDMKFQEVQDHVALLDDVYSPMVLMMSKGKLESFSPEIQDAIKEAAKIAVPYEREVKKEMTEDYLVKLEEAGMTVTVPDKESFKAKTDPVYDKWTKVFGADLIDSIRNYEY